MNMTMVKENAKRVSFARGTTCCTVSRARVNRVRFAAKPGEGRYPRHSDSNNRHQDNNVGVVEGNMPRRHVSLSQNNVSAVEKGAISLDRKHVKASHGFVPLPKKHPRGMITTLEYTARTL